MKMMMMIFLEEMMNEKSENEIFKKLMNFWYMIFFSRNEMLLTSEILMAKKKYIWKYKKISHLKRIICKFKAYFDAWAKHIYICVSMQIHVKKWHNIYDTVPMTI
jgi:hypothetical protein